MARRHMESYLSGKELSLDGVWDWYDFQGLLISEEKVRTLASLLTGASLAQPRYFGRTRDELIEFFDAQREELMISAMLALLAATEAALRVDYVVRVMNKKKDDVSRAFSRIYKAHWPKVGLETQILEVWKQHSTRPTKDAIGEFKGALKLRHWLAHGRYWRPQLGQDYDPREVFRICESLLNLTS